MDSRSRFFPSNHREALALEWASRHVGDAATPELLTRKYWEAYYRIDAVDHDACEAARAKFAVK